MTDLLYDLVWRNELSRSDYGEALVFLARKGYALYLDSQVLPVDEKDESKGFKATFRSMRPIEPSFLETEIDISFFKKRAQRHIFIRLSRTTESKSK
ncbi:MAG: hypothetical protein WC796_02785 [Candidatus Pacearchaeota archaeon]|jgi:hypothetical protein